LYRSQIGVSGLEGIGDGRDSKSIVEGIRGTVSVTLLGNFSICN